MRPTKLLFALSLGAGIALVPGAAMGHGDLERSDPGRGVHLRRAPKSVELSFAEPPTADSNFEVTDGCRDDVLAEVVGEGPNARLVIDGGRPGRWKVMYRVVSSVDGHLVRGSYSFHVGNKKPCEPEPEPTDEVGEAAPPMANDDPQSGSFPTIPVLVGLGVVGAAVAIRVMAAR